MLYEVITAAEVRKLAERSQLAASEIVALADRGLLLTKQSSDMLNEILPKIQNTSRFVITSYSIHYTKLYDTLPHL